MANNCISLSDLETKTFIASLNTPKCLAALCDVPRIVFCSIIMQYICFTLSCHSIIVCKANIFVFFCAVISEHAIDRCLNNKKLHI